ncbi:hypothetical protein CVS40_3127 [Lucilia cuprina]|nr:hypothetical protein CVS40_3127 [Lucilia cuprina]
MHRCTVSSSLATMMPHKEVRDQTLFNWQRGKIVMNQHRRDHNWRLQSLKDIDQVDAEDAGEILQCASLEGTIESYYFFPAPRRRNPIRLLYEEVPRICIEAAIFWIRIVKNRYSDFREQFYAQDH